MNQESRIVKHIYAGYGVIYEIQTLSTTNNQWYAMFTTSKRDDMLAFCNMYNYDTQHIIQCFHEI